MTDEKRRRIADRGRFLGKFKLVMLAQELDTMDEGEWRHVSQDS